MKTRPDHVLQILTATLVADATVAGLVGTRVFSAYPVDADAGTLQQPLVVVRLSSGSGDPTQPLATFAVALRVYSKTSAERPLEVYAACFDALARVGLKSTATDNQTVLAPLGDRTPRVLYDEVRRSWYAEGRWDVAAAG